MYLDLALYNYTPLEKTKTRIKLLDEPDESRYEMNIEHTLSRSGLNVKTFIGKTQGNLELVKQLTLNDKRIRCLEMILCNCIKYGVNDLPILYSRSHSKYPSEKLNPNNISAKPLIAVIDALGDGGFIINHAKPNRWGKEHEPGADDIGHTSEFFIHYTAIDLADFLGIFPLTIRRKETSHIILKPYQNEQEGIRTAHMSLDYKDDVYTKMIEEQMNEYSEFLGKFKIQCIVDKEERTYKDLHLLRTFIDYDNARTHIYNGRCYPSWTQLSGESRKAITIDDKPTVSLDYSASQLRWLYKWVSGFEFGTRVDPYFLEVDGHRIDREIVKRVCLYALNTKNISSATKYLNWWHEGRTKDGEYKDSTNPPIKWAGKKQAKTYKETMQIKGITPARIRDAFRLKHHEVGEYFYQGTKGGQFVAWIESNLVYSVAQQATKYGIPCLTVHDEFIVREEDAPMMESLMYSNPIYIDDDSFDYRGYVAWCKHRGDQAQEFKSSFELEF